jgi:hypothetical protein
MEHISEDDSLYKEFLEVLPNEIKITDEQKKNIFNLFVNIAYLYFMEQT